MATPIKMLRLSKGMESGQVVQWLKSPGDQVSQGEALLEVESDKSIVELQAPASGVLLKILVEAGQEVPVGTVLGWTGQPGEAVPPTAQSQPTSPTAQKVKASPALRHLASRHGIALETVQATGPSGRISKEDLERAIDLQKTGPQARQEEADVQRVALTGIRKTMAERMTRSTHATVTTVMDVDMRAIKVLKDRLSVTYSSPVVKAAALALREHGILNASLDGNEIIMHQRIHIGVAMDTPRGLVVATVSDADSKSLSQIDKQLRQFSQEARQNRLRLESMEAPTFTLTNSGVLGSLMFTPLISPPQSATLGMGKVQDTAVVREGQIEVRPIMYLCLTYDHRIIEGAQAVRFLGTIKEYLQDPKQLEED